MFVSLLNLIVKVLPSPSIVCCCLDQKIGRQSGERGREGEGEGRRGGEWGEGGLVEWELGERKGGESWERGRERGKEQQEPITPVAL